MHISISIECVDCGFQSSLEAKRGPLWLVQPNFIIQNYHKGLDESVLLNTTLVTHHLWFGNFWKRKEK